MNSKMKVVISTRLTTLKDKLEGKSVPIEIAEPASINFQIAVPKRDEGGRRDWQPWYSPTDCELSEV